MTDHHVGLGAYNYSTVYLLSYTKLQAAYSGTGSIHNQFLLSTTSTSPSSSSCHAMTHWHGLATKLYLQIAGPNN